MRRAVLALFATVAGLVGLLTFKTHPATVGTVPAAVGTTGPATSSSDPVSEPSTSASSSASGSSTSTSTSTSSSSARASASSTSTATATKTVTGDSVDTQWGPVQVKITVVAGKLTAASAVVYPTENPRDQQINAYAIPELNKEALAAGSAKIDMISGATYTSTGYINSLQSALDKAGL